MKTVTLITWKPDENSIELPVRNFSTVSIMCYSVDETGIYIIYPEKEDREKLKSKISRVIRNNGYFKEGLFEIYHEEIVKGKKSK